MSWCGTEPNPFLRSRKVNERGSPFKIAFSMIAEVAKVCSIVPLIPVKKPFCRLVSMILLTHRKCSSRIAIILLNSLPTTEVNAIGQKLSGLDRSWFLRMSLILAWHQDSGAVWSSKGSLIIISLRSSEQKVVFQMMISDFIFPWWWVGGVPFQNLSDGTRCYCRKVKFIQIQ